MHAHPPPAVSGVIALGASAGGIEALQRLMRELPIDLPAAVCIVLHIPATSRSLLATVIARQTPLPVREAEHGETLLPGHVYVAVPDQHLLVGADRIRLTRGPKENGVRPAIDPLFRSLAVGFGRRGIAVVLSGSLSDGAAGAASVAAAGGTVLVQDPEDAVVPSMPEAALAAVPRAPRLRAADLGTELTARAVALTHFEDAEADMSEEELLSPVERSRRMPPGPPVGLTCPECHGPLWELNEGSLVRYRCRVGHAYAHDVLLADKSAAIESALWMALVALAERGDLLDKVATRLEEQGHPLSAARTRARAQGTAERAELIRGVLAIDEEPLAATSR